MTSICMSINSYSLINFIILLYWWYVRVIPYTRSSYNRKIYSLSLLLIDNLYLIKTKMYNSNHISMGFGCCHCRHCRHVWKDKHWRWKNYSRYYHYGRLRTQQYKKIIKTLRQFKHKEELPKRLFNLMSYTD